MDGSKNFAGRFRPGARRPGGLRRQVHQPVHILPRFAPRAHALPLVGLRMSTQLGTRTCAAPGARPSALRTTPFCERMPGRARASARACPCAFALAVCGTASTKGLRVRSRARKDAPSATRMLFCTRPVIHRFGGSGGRRPRREGRGLMCGWVDRWERPAVKWRIVTRRT